MADAEKSLLFVIRCSIEDFNTKLKQAEKSFKSSFGQIQKELDQAGKRFMTVGGAITGMFAGMVMKAAESSALVKEPLDKIKAQFDALFKTIAENPAIINLLNQFADLITKAVEWITKHPDLVAAFLKVGMAVLAVGVALKAAAVAMAFLMALSGAGILKVVLAGVAAAGAYVALNEMMKTPAGETPEIPAMASGGIFTRPTLAMIGEAGPEAAIPLNKMGGMGGGGGDTHIHFHGDFMGDETSLRKLETRLGRVRRQESSRSEYGPSRTGVWSRSGHL